MAPKVPKRNANDAAQTRKQPVASNICIHRGVGMPRRFQTTLRCVYIGNFAATGTSNTVGFGCNTPNKPIRAVADERCGYWDKLTALYDRVYTLRSRCTLEVTNITVADGTRIVLSHDSTSITSSNINDLSEKEGAVEKILGPSAGGRVFYTATHEWDPRSYIGVAPNSTANTAEDGDPPNPYFWIAAYQTTGGGSGNLTYKVVIEYDVVFSELTFPFE